MTLNRYAYVTTSRVGEASEVNYFALIDGWRPGARVEKARFKSAMKILIIKRDKIGDMLLTTPLLRHLRHALPDAQIDMLANDYNAWVVERHSAIDRLWVYRRARAGSRIRLGAAIAQLWQTFQLRWQRYDIAIIAGGEESPRATKRVLRINAKRMIGFCSSADCRRALSDPLEPLPSEHEVGRMLRLLQPLGIEPPTEPIYPEFSPDATAIEAARAWLAGRNLGNYVIIGLGARRAKKQPSTAQVLRWSEHIFRHWQLPTVFMWTPGPSDNALYPGDDEIAEPVVRAQRDYIHPFRGPLQPAIGLIWHARCSIFPDSGLMHFAAASPGGVLGLFADTNVSPSPAQWGPVGPRARFLEAQVAVAELRDNQIYSEIEDLLN